MSKKKLPKLKHVLMRSLWSYEDIAVILQCKPNTVRDKYARLESFPARRGGGELGKPMFRASEVQAWADRKTA